MKSLVKHVWDYIKTTFTNVSLIYITIVLTVAIHKALTNNF